MGNLGTRRRTNLHTKRTILLPLHIRMQSPHGRRTFHPLSLPCTNQHQQHPAHTWYKHLLLLPPLQTRRPQFPNALLPPPLLQKSIPSKMPHQGKTQRHREHLNTTTPPPRLFTRHQHSPHTGRPNTLKRTTKEKTAWSATKSKYHRPFTSSRRKGRGSISRVNIILPTTHTRAIRGTAHGARGSV